MSSLTPAGVGVLPASAIGARKRSLSRWPRGLAAAAALLLLPAFFLPLWRYDLDAPQYPEGISMTISINRLGGRIDLVNGLNHYIGMRAIEADSFPELRLMPWILGFFCLSGLVVAALGRLSLLGGWVTLLALGGIVGLADLYRWLWEFGHTLSPDAPITVEPFTPPLIGPKTVVNFQVVTYPDVGGLAIVGALLVAAVALFIEVRMRRREAPG